MKSLALLISSLEVIGGLQKAALAMADAFNRHGYRVELISQGNLHKLENKPFQLVSLGKKAQSSFYSELLFRKRCENYLRKRPFTIVFGLERSKNHTHYRAGNGIHAVFLERRKLFEPRWKKALLTLNPRHKAFLRWEKQSFQNPNVRLIITNSSMVKREIKEYFSPLAPVEVVYNGTDMDLSLPYFEQWPFQRRLFLKKLFIPSSCPQLLFVGHGFRRKGLLELLYALEPIKQLDWHLHVLGKDKNLAFYQKMVKYLGIDQRIHFWGAKQNIYAFYQIADLFIQPSWYDPFANTTLEALTMGIFTISSSFNGACEIFEKHTGVSFSLLDYENTLSTKIKQHLTLKTEFSSSNIRNSVVKWSWQSQLTKLVDQSEKHV